MIIKTSLCPAKSTQMKLPKPVLRCAIFQSFWGTTLLRDVSPARSLWLSTVLALSRSVLPSNPAARAEQGYTGLEKMKLKQITLNNLCKAGSYIILTVCTKFEHNPNKLLVAKVTVGYRSFAPPRKNNAMFWLKFWNFDYQIICNL